MAQRTISNRDNLQERNRVENRIWDAINRLENATAPAVIQQVVKATATQVAQQAVANPTGIVYLVENNGGEIVYDEDGHAKLYTYQIGG